MHETLPSGIAPCCNCVAYDEWKPKGEIDLGGPVTGIDIGMPDGTKIPVKIDDDERKPVVKSTGIHMGVVIGYAIDGIRGRASHLGLLLTDKTISVDALANTILELQSLCRDWETLEDSLAAIREEAEHVKDRDA
jgi:hypothetical protein